MHLCSTRNMCGGPTRRFFGRAMPPGKHNDAKADTIVLREFRRRDVDAILAIAGESPEAAVWSRQSYEQLPEQPEALAFVLEGSREVVGFLIARRAAEEAEILNIAIRR